jgi:hypothetical protein
MKNQNVLIRALLLAIVAAGMNAFLVNGVGQQ